MEAAVDLARLPLTGLSEDRPAPRSEGGAAKSFNLALRHVEVPFDTKDRLALLYGHSLVSRLSIYAATDRVLAGEPVVYLDGDHTFDPFLIGRLARARRQQPRKVLSMIHVARAFSGHQMERLITNCLAGALVQYQARTAIISGLFEMVSDESMSDRDIARLSDRIVESLRQLGGQGHSLLCLCPAIPMATARGHRLYTKLRGLADHLIRVQETQGIVLLEEERPIADRRRALDSPF